MLLIFSLFLYLSLALSPTRAQHLPTLTSVKTGIITPTSTPSLTRIAIAISTAPASGDEPTQIGFFLSPDLQKTLQDTLDYECKIVDFARCAVHLHAPLKMALFVPDDDLQSNYLPSASFLVAVAAAAITWEISHRSQQLYPVKVSAFYSFETDQLLKIPDPSILVIETGRGTVRLFADSVSTSRGLRSRDPTSNYVLVPKLASIAAAQADRLAFEDRIKRAGIALTRVLSDNLVDLWTADLIPSQLDIIKKEALIEWIVPNDKVLEPDETDNPSVDQKRRAFVEDEIDLTDYVDLTRRDDPPENFIRQSNAPMELNTLSNLGALPNAKGDYDYVSSAGSGANVFLIEHHPFLLAHSEIGRSPSDPNVDGWISPHPGDRKPLGLFPPLVAQVSGHATRVLSKLIGKTLGVAKNANIICVMLNANHVADHILGWREIVADAIAIKDRSRRPTIINYSRHFPIASKDFPVYYPLMRELFQYLRKEGVIVVLAAGNDPKAQIPPGNGDVYLEQETAYMNPDLGIVMAGYTWPTGVPVLLGHNRYANVWAIGKGNEVADPQKPDGGTEFRGGSSFAAPIVSGLLATFFDDEKITHSYSMYDNPRAPLNLLLQTSSLRAADALQKDAVPLVYNLAHHDICPRKWLRRDGSAAPPPVPDCISLDPTATTGQWQKRPQPTPPPPTISKLPVITSGSGSGKCGNSKREGTVGISSKPIDKNALQKCLLNLDVSDWHNQGNNKVVDCEGMVTFQSASTGWQSAADCHNSCKNCLSESIEAGVNQIWCDAWAGAMHCWEGYIITPPPLVTDGSPFGDDPWLKQTIAAYDYKGINGRYIDMYQVQDCIRHFDGSRWWDHDKPYDCGGMVRFDMYSNSRPVGWNSPSDCWNAIKNCLSDAVNKGASQAWCEKSAGTVSCIGGFFPN